MGYVENYSPTVAKLVTMRGSLGVDSQGFDVPGLTGDDTVGLLGLYVAGLRRAVGRIADKIVISDFVRDDGLFTVPTGGGVLQTAQWAVLAQSHAREVQTYLSAPAVASLPYKRRCWPTNEESLFAAQVGVTELTWEPCRTQEGLGRNPQLEQVAFLRNAMFEYQRALEASTEAYKTYQDGPIGKDSASAFLKALRQLGSSLDVMDENPPTTWEQDLKGALKAAKGATSEALKDAAKAGGEIVGDIANAAGEVAGRAVEGFLSTANMLTLIVAGVVVYKVIP